MYVTNRCVAALGAIAAVGLAACGGGDSGVVVARVEGVGSISKAALDHWIPVEAVVLYQEYPTKPVPKGVVPDPPDYTACIAYLKSARQSLVESGPKPTALQLKGKCRQKSQELQEITLNTLILWDWTIAAGEALGMKASDAEVRQRFAEENKNLFPRGKAELANYLKLTGQTVADMLFRSRVEVFEGKLIERRNAMQKLGRRALAKFLAYLPPGKRWATITSCHAGYVVSACRQYRGPHVPGGPN